MDPKFHAVVIDYYYLINVDNRSACLNQQSYYSLEML